MIFSVHLIRTSFWGEKNQTPKFDTNYNTNISINSIILIIKNSSKSQDWTKLWDMLVVGWKHVLPSIRGFITSIIMHGCMCDNLESFENQTCLAPRTPNTVENILFHLYSYQECTIHISKCNLSKPLHRGSRRFQKSSVHNFSYARVLDFPSWLMRIVVAYYKVYDI